jgi:cysteine synthase
VWSSDTCPSCESSPTPQSRPIRDLTLFFAIITHNVMTIPDLGNHGLKLSPTPLIALRLEPEGQAEAPTIWCKLEFLNPSGSTKDRIARHILEKAWRRGVIGPGSKIVEASSGSTSIALALCCAQMGLRFTAVMPEGVSNERVWMIRAYGGDVAFVPRQAGIGQAIAYAEELATRWGAFAPRQFTNADNAEAHRIFTGQEILAQIPGGVVHGVVSGVGTGGTIVGLHAALSEAGCPVVPFVARPVSRSTFTDFECCSFSTRVPGVVDGIATLFHSAHLPGLVTIEVDDDEALATTRRLIARGFPVGPSSGLNYAAACEANRRLGPAARVVTVFPDRMERYFSTELFACIRDP